MNNMSLWVNNNRHDSNMTTLLETTLGGEYILLN